MTQICADLHGFYLEHKKPMLRRETSVCIRYYFNYFVPIAFLASAISLSLFLT